MVDFYRRPRPRPRPPATRDDLTRDFLRRVLHAGPNTFAAMFDHLNPAWAAAAYSDAEGRGFVHVDPASRVVSLTAAGGEFLAGGPVE